MINMIHYTTQNNKQSRAGSDWFSTKGNIWYAKNDKNLFLTGSRDAAREVTNSGIKITGGNLSRKGKARIAVPNFSLKVWTFVHDGTRYVARTREEGRRLCRAHGLPQSCLENVGISLDHHCRLGQLA
jgi:hypothetical protein